MNQELYARTVEDIQGERAVQLGVISELITKLEQELDYGNCTVSQRINVLAEIRKNVQLRSLLLGLVVSQDFAENAHV